MAVLSKIRKNSVLLVGAIGVGLFAFVIGDVFQSGGFDQSTRYAGTINGEDIEAIGFLNKVQNAEANQQGTGIQASNRVWEEEVKRILLTAEFEKIGIQIGKDQLINVIKTSPNFGQNPQFLNQAGVFDVNKFNEFLATIKQSNPEQWKAWLEYEKQLEQFAKEQMYNSLIRASVYTTKFDAKQAYKAEKDAVAFDYVTLQYATVNDDQVKVSDAEIAAYIKKNKTRFKAENSRGLEYVFIANAPSEADIKSVETKMNDLLSGAVVYNKETGKNDTLSGFKNTKNVVEFVNSNSDVPYDSTFISKKDLPVEFQEQLYALPVGGVFGPYEFNGYSCLSKKTATSGVASAKVSHILISFEGAQMPNAPQRTKEEAKAKAAELLAQVNANPGSFAMLAMTNTDDTGSKQTGGVYDNVQKGQMVKPFENFLFNNPVGKTGIVETDFGYHVMKVEALYGGIQLATIARKIEPSTATSDKLYQTATTILAAATEGKDIKDLAKTNGLEVLPVTVRHNQDQVGALGSHRDVVLWSFNKSTSEGDVKKFEFGEGQVIVKLTEKNDSGLASVEEVKQYVTPILMNEKKAAILKDKMKGATLEEIAKNSKSSVVNANGVTFSAPFITNVGNEPKVVGKAFGTAAGKVSGVIEGNTGVFVVKPVSVTKAPELPSYEENASRLKQMNQGSASGRAFIALKNSSTIEDNRYKVQ